MRDTLPIGHDPADVVVHQAASMVELLQLHLIRPRRSRATLTRPGRDLFTHLPPPLCGC